MATIGRLMKNLAISGYLFSALGWVWLSASFPVLPRASVPPRAPLLARHQRLRAHDHAFPHLLGSFCHCLLSTLGLPRSPRAVRTFPDLDRFDRDLVLGTHYGHQVPSLDFCYSPLGMTRAAFLIPISARTRLNCRGRRRFFGFGNRVATRMVPVLTSTWRSQRQPHPWWDRCFHPRG